MTDGAHNLFPNMVDGTFVEYVQLRKEYKQITIENKQGISEETALWRSIFVKNRRKRRAARVVRTMMKNSLNKGNEVHFIKRHYMH